MAEDKNDLEFDDVDDFDFDIPDIDVEMQGDDRSPVRKLSTGFAQGVKDDLTDRRDAPRKIKSVLPESYESSVDLADETLNTAGNLYNSLITETREGVKDLKGAARQAVGKHSEKLPDWLNKKLDGLLSDDDSRDRQPSKDEIRDEEIQNSLASVFQLQVQNDEERRHEDEGTQAVRDAIEGKRYENEVEQLFGIRKELNRQVTYQDQVTARFQRKSLEMQYRQYFTTKDILAVSEAYAKDTKEALQAISKNTSLPEYRKLELTESVGQQMRDRFTGSIQDKIGELSGGFFSRISDSLTKSVTEKAKGWGQQMSAMAGAANMMNESSEMLDGTEMMGSTAGGQASSFLFRQLAPLIRKATTNIEGFDALGQDVNQGVDNLPRAINEWAKQNQGAGGIAGLIADAIGARGLDSGLEAGGIADSERPAVFDRLTRQSIVEIIPGYLSRIHHELMTFREGMGVAGPDPDGRMTYNLKERGFSTAEREREAIRDTIFNPEGLGKAFDRMTDVFDSLDIGEMVPSDQEEDVRKALSQYLMKEHFDGNKLSLERLSDASSFGDSVPPEIAAQIASAVQERYETRYEDDQYGNRVFRHRQDDETRKRINKTENAYNRINEDVTNPRELIQAFLQVGNEQQLNDLGLLEYNRDGNPSVNYDQVFRVIEQGGYDDLGGEAQRDRRENRRYERYFEDVEGREKARQDREYEEQREQRKRERFEESLVGRKTKGVRGKLTGAQRKAEEALQLRKDRRYSDIPQASEANRGIGDAFKWQFADAAKNGGLSQVTGNESLVTRPGVNFTSPELNREARLVSNIRKLGDTTGRQELKEATIQRSADTYRKAKDAQTYKNARDKIANYGKRNYDRAMDSDIAKRYDVSGRVEGATSQLNQQAENTSIRLKVMRLLSRLDPEGNLSREQKGLLQQQLMMELQTGGDIDLEKLKDPDYYLDDIDATQREKLAEHFRSNGVDGTAEDKLDRALNVIKRKKQPEALTGEEDAQEKEKLTDKLSTGYQKRKKQIEDVGSDLLSRYDRERTWADNVRSYSGDAHEGFQRKLAVGKVKFFLQRSGLGKALDPDALDSFEELLVWEVLTSPTKNVPPLEELTSEAFYPDTFPVAHRELVIEKIGELLASETADAVNRSMPVLGASGKDAEDLTQEEDLALGGWSGNVSRWASDVRNNANDYVDQSERLSKIKKDVGDLGGSASGKVKQVATNNRAFEYLKDMSGFGRGEAVESATAPETKPRGFSALTSAIGELTRAIRKRDHTDEDAGVAGGYPDNGNLTGGLHGDDVAAGGMAGSVTGAGRGYGTLPAAANDDSLDLLPGEEGGQVIRPEGLTLTGLLSDVRGILRGDEEGVTQETRHLVSRLTTDGQVQSDEAQVAVLSRILENVEAIGQHITKDDEESWFNILDIGKKTGRVMAKTAGAFGNYYLGALKMMGGGMSGLGGLLKGTGRGAGRLVGRLVGRKGKGNELGAMDVYLQHQSEPVLFARQMKDGEYLDSETQEPITTVDDLGHLEGDVIDREGNIVATAAELAKGIYDAFGEKIGDPGLLSGIASAVGKGVSAYWNFMTAPARMLFSAPKKLLGMASKFVNRVKDVYVKGETTPRLLATIMKNGGYVSATTGRPLKTLRDIDGEVLDRQGNVILSHEDMRLGLVDWKGEPIDFLDRQIGRIVGAVKIPYKAAEWAFGKAKGMVAGAGEMLGKVTGGIASGIGWGKGSSERLEETSDEQLDVLKEIRDLISDHYGGKQPDKWDTDGDGMRDGGWRDQFADRDKEEQEEDPVDKARDEKDGSFLDTLMKFAGPLLSMVGSGIGLIMDKVTGLFGTLGDMLMAKMGMNALGDLANPGGGPDRDGNNQRKGWLRRTGSWLWDKTKKGGKAAWNFGKWALPAAGKWALRGAAWTGTKLLAGAAMAGGILTAPVLLTGAAIATVAVGGYFAWKHFSGNDLDKLGKHRMLQYGVDPENEDQVSKLLLLEDRLKGNTHFEGSSLEVDESVDFVEIAGEFGVDPEDQDAVTRFVTWLNGRFLPVYAKAKTTLADVNPDKTLEDIDDLTIAEKVKYFRDASRVESLSEDFPHPYQVKESPFGEQSVLAIGASTIEARTREIEEELDTEHQRFLDNRERVHTGDELPPNHPMQRARAADQRRSTPSGIVDAFTEDTESYTTAETRNRRQNFSRQLETRRQTMVAQGEEIGINFVSDDKELRKIEAWSAILFKTMGLRSLDSEKVQTLTALKDYVLDGVTYNTNGVAFWEGDPDDVLKRFRNRFDIGWYEWGDKKSWKRWFQNRFLKVLLTFLSAVRREQDDPAKALEDAMENPGLLATAGETVASLEVTIGDEEGIPVWLLDDSPWEGYVLNSDRRSVWDYILYLKDLAAGGESESPVEGMDTFDPEVTRDNDVPETDWEDEMRAARQRRRAEQRQRWQQEGGGQSNPPSRSPAQNRAAEQAGTNSGGDVHGLDGGGGSHTRATVPQGEGYKTVVGGLVEAGITDPEEQAMALAQLAHESANFTALEENLNYGADGLLSTFGKYFPTRAEAERFARKPEAIANRTYGGRMGNREEGDGWKYRGRGFIQLTGRENYERASAALGYDYVNNPDLVSEPEHAARVSLWWWKDRNGLRPAAQQGDVRQSTRLINGGYNGLADRQSKYRNYLPVAQQGQVTEEGTRELADASGEEPTTDPMEETATQPVSTNQNSSGDTGTVADAVSPPETTVRQAVVSNASIDSSTGINQALSRDVEQIEQQRQQQAQLTTTRDQEDRERNNAHSESMNSVRKVLEDSLGVQRSMDGRLEAVVKLLQGEDRQGRLQREDTQQDGMQVASENSSRRQNNMDFDPRAVSNAVIDLGRRRSV